MFGVALTTRTASARDPYEPSTYCRPAAAIVEIAPWLTLGSGVRRERDGAYRGVGTIAVNVAGTLEVFKHLRAGAWASPGTVNFSSVDLAAGGRLELQTNDYNGQYSGLFGVGGRYSLLLDAGVGNRFGPSDNRGGFFVARIAAGFTAPNRLYGPYVNASDCGCDEQSTRVCRHSYGIVAGVRPYFLVHRALDGSRTELTGGLEFEVVGAAWWLGGGG